MSCPVLNVDARNLACEGNLTLSNETYPSVACDCTEWLGNVIISTNATRFLVPIWLSTIVGDFICEHNSGLKQLNLAGDVLSNVTGTIRLVDMPVLERFRLSQLQAVGRIELDGLPSLHQLEFFTGGSQVSSILVHNTGLDNLTGLNPSSMQGIDIRNNTRLGNVNLSSLVESTGPITFEQNSASLSISLDALKSSGSLVMNGVNDLSMPNLSVVSGTMSIFQNGNPSLDLDRLESISGSLEIEFSNLIQLPMPNLNTIGGSLTLTDNGELDDITLLSLQEVRESISISRPINRQVSLDH